MVGGIAVKQAAVPELVAVAVARLLGNHFRDLARNLIGPGHQWVAPKVRSWHQPGERLGRFRAFVLGRNRSVGEWPSARR